MAIPHEVATLLDKNLHNGKKIRVLSCDICQVEAEGYILPCGGSIDFGGLVGTAMLKKCPGLAQAAAAAGQVNMPVGGACSFKLPANHGFNTSQKGCIIPTHSPKWDVSREQDCSEELYQCAQNCLKEADKLKLYAVAMPVIGSGGNNIPKQLAAMTLLSAVKHFLTEPPGGSTGIEAVYFVLFDKQMVDLFKNELIALVE